MCITCLYLHMIKFIVMFLSTIDDLIVLANVHVHIRTYI